MSRLSNRVQKLESITGIVDLEQLQRNNPDLDLSLLSQKHLVRFAEMQRDTTLRSVRELSSKELKESLAFSGDVWVRKFPTRAFCTDCSNRRKRTLCPIFNLENTPV